MAAPCCQTPFLPWSTFNESCRDAAIDIALQYFNYGDNPQVLLGLTSASQRWCEIYFDGDFEYRPQRASLLTQLHSDIFNTSAAPHLRLRSTSQVMAALDLSTPLGCPGISESNRQLHQLIKSARFPLPIKVSRGKIRAAHLNASAVRHSLPEFISTLAQGNLANETIIARAKKSRVMEAATFVPTTNSRITRIKINYRTPMGGPNARRPTQRGRPIRKAATPSASRKSSVPSSTSSSTTSSKTATRVNVQGKTTAGKTHNELPIGLPSPPSSYASSPSPSSSWSSSLPRTRRAYKIKVRLNQKGKSTTAATPEFSPVSDRVQQPTPSPSPSREVSLPTRPVHTLVSSTGVVLKLKALTLKREDDSDEVVVKQEEEDDDQVAMPPAQKV